MVASAARVLNKVLFSEQAKTQLPYTVTLGVIAVCVFPILLTLMGFSFGSQSITFDIQAAQEYSKAELPTRV